MRELHLQILNHARNNGGCCRQRSTNLVVLAVIAAGAAAMPFMREPPISIASDAGAEPLKTDSIAISGVVTDPALSETMLYVNGEGRRVPVAGGRFSETIPLTAGVNVVQAFAPGIAENFTAPSNLLRITADIPPGPPRFLISPGIRHLPAQRFALTTSTGFRTEISMGANYYLEGTLIHAHPENVAAVPPSPELGDPYQYVTEVRTIFDNSVQKLVNVNGCWQTLPPLGATDLRHIEIDWQWKGIKKTVVF